ncbi:MAG: hypothetical protein V4506_10555 [Bacteroidota bacterium]
MKQPYNILVITYWSFSDALIQTYTLPYLKIISQKLPAGSKIFLVTLEKENFGITAETAIPGILNIRFKYLAFGLAASFDWMKNIFALNRIVKKNNIQGIHSFCTPAGMIGFLLSRLTGKPHILDSYEPHAEAMVENGEWKANSISFKLLNYFERKQTETASQIIGTTAGMKDYALKKFNTQLNHFYVKPACVDLNAFNLGLKKDSVLLDKLNLQNKIVCVYAGKFGGIYLKEEVFEFYKACYQKWKNNFVALILTGHSVEEMHGLIQQAGLPVSAFRIEFVEHALIPKYIGLGDFAITPVKPVNTKKYCTPIKNGEYWAMGLPVVITKDISVDSDIIAHNNIGYVLQQPVLSEYVNAVNKMDELLKDPSVPLKIRTVAEKERNFSIAEKVYTAIYA